MDTFISALSSTLTPHVIASMIGGFLGTLISSDRKRYGWQLSLLFIIASIGASAAVGEYLHYKREIDSIWWLFVLNIPLGMIAGATLDVLRITSPPLIERLIVGITDSGVNIVIESVLRKIANIFGIDIKVEEPSVLKKPKAVDVNSEEKDGVSGK